MSTPHLSPELLRLIVDGHLPPKTLVRTALEHLLELCPECRDTWQRFKQQQPQMAGALKGDDEVVEPAEDAAAPAADDGSYDDTFERAAALLREHRHHGEQTDHGEPADEEESRAEAGGTERRSACGSAPAPPPGPRAADAGPQQDLERLLALPASERRRAVRESVHRFQGCELVEALLGEARRWVRRDTEESRRLAELAHLVLERTLEELPRHGAEPPDWAVELEVRCLAEVGNALRAGGDLPAADEHFARARAHLARYPLNDSRLHADLAVMEATLRNDQHRRDEAGALLDRAAFLYREERNPAGVVHVRIQQGQIHLREGDPEQAAELFREALRTLGPEGDRGLRLPALANLALAFCDAGDFAGARSVLDEHGEAFRRHGGRWMELRLRWIEGRTAAGQGRLETAEELLVHVYRSFRDRDEGFNAALAALDLAVVHLGTGNRAEVVRLSQEMSAVFSRLELPQEATAAFILFQRAVAAETVSRELITDLRRRLDRARAARPPTSRVH